MSYRGLPNWPPTWVQISGSRDQKQAGEIGILDEVLSSQVEPFNRCYLFITFEGESYIGTLLFEDVKFCRQIYELLQHYSGKSIRRIGGVHVGHLL